MLIIKHPQADRVHLAYLSHLFLRELDIRLDHSDLTCEVLGLHGRVNLVVTCIYASVRVGALLTDDNGVACGDERDVLCHFIALFYHVLIDCQYRILPLYA